jgi:hypothetical protein
MSVVKHINIKNLVPEFESQIIRNTTHFIQQRAQTRVRKDTRNLMASIRISGPYVFSDLPYARAQEYGLEAYGKPNYDYTEYMRPAVKDAESNIAQLTSKSMAETLAKV